ncbi:ABC transporter permease [Lachnospira pectinoschiza]|uniref:Putative ABC transport system permease protein n=1 Tax=Lachnospira pectinoschiza TaxID=28052 RepID=A0A1G9T3F5_9FIRM|nr:ABC transporter permease [Lachnospira pectinoschiza]SDM42284.1 putative ABC transport system permease protein [Lachnospira pectinoschiza]
MSIFRKYTRESLKKNRTRTLVTIIGIILSMTLFTAVIEGANSGIVYMRDMVKEIEGSYHGFVSNLDQEQLEKLKNNSDIDKVAYLEDQGVAKFDSENPDKPYIRIAGMSENLENLASVGLKQGRMPENENEIIIPDNILTNGGMEFSEGEEIELSLGTREVDGEIINPDMAIRENVEETLINTVSKKYKIVGVYNRLSYELDSRESASYLALTVDNKTNIYENVNAFFTVKKLSDYDKVASKLKTDLGVDAVYSHRDLLGLYGALGGSAIADTIKGFAGFLLVLIVVGSVSLIYNSFAISVSERTKRIGILKSVGATKKQIRACIRYEASVLSLIAIPIGIIIGCLGMGITLYFLRDNFSATSYEYAKTQIKLAISPLGLLLAAIICYITTLIAAWIPARRAIKITALDAIRQTTDIKVSPKQLKTSKLTLKLFGFEAMMAKKNFKRNKKKYNFTIISIAASIILFITTSSFCAYADRAIFSQFKTLHNDIYYHIWQDWDVKALANDLSKLDKVDEIGFLYDTESLLFDINDDYLTKDSKKYSDDLNVYANKQYVACKFMDDEEFNELCNKYNLDSSEYYDSNNIKALLKNNLSETHNGKNYRYNVIDKNLKNFDINIAADKLNASDEKEEMAVNQIKKDTAFKVGACIELDDYILYNNMALVYPHSMLNEVLEQKFHGLYDTEMMSKEIYVKAKDHKKAYSNIEQYLIAKGYTSSGLEDARETLEAEMMMIEIVDVFSYGFIILMSLITVANIFNTISTSIMLRKKEIAMLKSVGMSESGVRKMLNYECINYGFKSLILGLPVSIALSYVLYKISSMNNVFNYMLPYRSILIAAISVFIVVFVSMLYSNSKIKKENTIDALKNENA